MSDNKIKSIKVTIPETIRLQVESTLEKLKSLKSTATIDDLFKSLFDKADENYFAKQLELLTPQTHLIEEAVNDPAIREKLAEYAKKLLSAKSEGKVLPKARLRSKGNVIENEAV